MGQIFRDMTAEERSFYEEDGKKFPWLMTVHMSDDEFLACIERDRGKGFSALLFNDLWNKHYSWVFLAVLKHFYETGEFVHYDWDYTDSQTETLAQIYRTRTSGYGPQESSPFAKSPFYG